MAHSDGGVPAWDKDRAAYLVGRSVIVGVTHVSADGKTVVNREQFHGLIASAIEGQGIAVVCLSGPNEGQTVTLPPVTTPYLDAKPGTYTLKPGGEKVENPQLTVAWTVTQQPTH